MKRIFSFVIIVTSLLFFFGCGGSGGGWSTSTTTSSDDELIKNEEKTLETIQIADNNFGEWELDSIQTIAWSDPGQKSDTRYTLYVTNANKTSVSKIDFDVVGNKYDWRVGKFTQENLSLKPDSKYYIKILSADGKNEYGISKSSFTYKTNLRRIKVNEMNPSNIRAGEKEIISWTDNKFVSDSSYTIFITDVNGAGYGIAGEVTGKTVFLWTVGSISYGGPYLNLPSGNAYYIQIVPIEPFSFNKGAYSRTKNPFFIEYQGEKGAPPTK